MVMAKVKWTDRARKDYVLIGTGERRKLMKEMCIRDRVISDFIGVTVGETVVTIPCEYCTCGGTETRIHTLKLVISDFIGVTVGETVVTIPCEYLSLIHILIELTRKNFA